MPSEIDQSAKTEGHGLGSAIDQLWRRSRGTVSLTMVGVCVAVFLAIAVLERLGVVPRNEAIGFLGLSYVGVFHCFWLHQFLTAPLMHGCVTHLLFNMLSLWMLGPEIEQVLGRRRYILFSTICAESSMVGFLLFNWGTGNIVLGYSGVIFGILVAQAVFFPSNTIVIFAFFPLRMKYAVLLLGVVELYFMLAPDGGGIAHAAHLFGALAALIYLKAPTWCRRLRLPNEAPPKRPAIRRAVQRKAWKDVPREL